MDTIYVQSGYEIIALRASPPKKLFNEIPTQVRRDRNTDVLKSLNYTLKPIIPTLGQIGKQNKRTESLLFKLILSFLN